MGKVEKEEKEEERDAEEQEGKQVKKDETGWTVVTRNKRQRKMVQVFVKVDGGKTSTMEVEMSDRVDDIVKKTPISDQDVYVTSGGRILRRRDKLESCEVRDGSILEVTSRMRGGGRHKDKKSKSEKKQTTNSQRPEKRDGEARSGEGPELVPMDEVLRQLEESEEYQKKIEYVSEGSEGEVPQKVQDFLACMQVSWMIKEQYEPLESGVWRAVEARRKRWGEEQEERRQAQEWQEQSKQGKQVRFDEEEELEKTGAENAGEPEVMGRTTEVRTGRRSTGPVRGRDERYQADETNRKGKGKGNGGKGEHEGKGGGFGSKGFQQSVKEADEEDERVRMAPNMGAGGSHLQATSDPGEREIEEKRETRGMRWADCEDDEGKEKEGQEKEKETRQETKEAESKKEQEAARKQEQEQEGPPGLEEVESEPKTQGEEQSQVESEQEAQEEEESGRAQEAREEERRAQEAREEERRAQEAQEKKRAQEAREEENRAREAREEQRRAQEAPELRRSEREVSAQEERTEQEREAKAQGGARE